jgi:ankyrin repeat protein
VGVNIIDSDGSTPLQLLCNMSPTEEQRACIESLVDSGADVNIQQPKDGDTPLHLCIRHGNIAGVNYLLDRGADPTVPNREGDIPLHLAARLGQLMCLQAIVLKTNSSTQSNNTSSQSSKLISSGSRRSSPLVTPKHSPRVDPTNADYPSGIERFSCKSQMS